MRVRGGLVIVALAVVAVQAVESWLAAPAVVRGIEPGDDLGAARAAYRAAFVHPVPVVHPQVEAFRVRAVRLGPVRTGAIDLFDPERLTAESGCGVPVADVYLAVGRGLSRRLPDWAGAAVCRVEVLPGGQDCVAFVMHPTGPARWWLTECDGVVRAYDFEDCRVGIRLSEVLRAGCDPATAESTAAALAALSQDGPADWEAVVAATASVPIRVLVRLQMASQALRDGRPRVALGQANAADAERPGLAGADLVRVRAYEQLGDDVRATEARERYRSILGELPPEPAN